MHGNYMHRNAWKVVLLLVSCFEFKLSKIILCSNAFHDIQKELITIYAPIKVFHLLPIKNGNNTKK